MSCDGIAIGNPCAADVVAGQVHQGFDLRFGRERDVDRHLIAVEVGVERRQSGWMRIAFPSTSTGSNAWMPRRCSVGRGSAAPNMHRIASPEDVPDFGRSSISFACLMVATSPRSSSLL